MFHFKICILGVCSKQCSPSYFTKELQVKVTRYHYTATKQPKSKTMTTSRAGEAVEQQRARSLPIGKQNGTVTSGNRLPGSYKTKQNLPTWSSNCPRWGLLQRAGNLCPAQTCTQVWTAALSITPLN